jgi:hypothetical protein
VKLSDTQLLILSSASRRTDHAALLPANLKGGAAKKVIDKLLNEKLLQELRAKDEMPVWRRGDDNRAYSLRITKAGLRAIEVEDATEASDDSPAAHPVEAATEDASVEAKSPVQSSRARQRLVKKTAGASAAKSKTSPDRNKPDSKQDRVITLLQRPEGATLDFLVGATDWQTHSVRGFLAGTVRKKLKLPLLSEKIDGVRTYRIGTVKSARTKKASAARKA